MKNPIDKWVKIIALVALAVGAFLLCSEGSWVFLAVWLVCGVAGFCPWVTGLEILIGMGVGVLAQRILDQGWFAAFVWWVVLWLAFGLGWFFSKFKKKWEVQHGRVGTNGS